jgi:hypothetical protein
MVELWFDDPICLSQCSGVLFDLTEAAEYCKLYADHRHIEAQVYCADCSKADLLGPQNFLSNPTGHPDFSRASRSASLSSALILRLIMYS